MSQYKVHISIVMFVAAICISYSHAQSSADDAMQQTFETASLRLVKPNAVGLTSISPWGSHQFRAVNISLVNLLSIAYGIDSRYISGIPKQLEERLYTVIAVAQNERGLSYEEIHAPLQKLLIERLHLIVHTPTSLVSGYRLIPMPTGVRLIKANSEENAGAHILENELKAQALTLDTFAHIYASILDRPVSDQTGLAGTYNFDIHFSRLDQQDSDFPSALSALEEQCGLKLIPAKVSVASLVIDHIDLSPTDD